MSINNECPEEYPLDTNIKDSGTQGTQGYITKDSGERVEFASGFRRDTNKGKPRYDLIPPECLKRLAELLARGASKYGPRNWEKAETEEEIERFKESAFRHFMDWRMGDENEDNASGCVFNIFAFEFLTKYKKKKESITHKTYNSEYLSSKGIKWKILCESDGIWKGYTSSVILQQMNYTFLIKDIEQYENISSPRG